MIGRKIVDRVDQLLHAPELSDNRSLQPPPLRIDTGRCRLTGGTALTERTNMAVNPNSSISPRISAHSYFTPNTSFTFGVPNPTTYCPARVESPCGSGSEASSRSNRYSVAEQALVSALKSSEGERCPVELQICALQQATTALDTRAKESRERVAKLKLTLTTERDTDPGMYVALQQERWMEEKRQFAVDKEVEVLTQQLTRLMANRGSDQSEDENRSSSPALNNEAKRSANLARFFDYSPTRTSFDLNLKCRLALDQPFPRRTTMSDVSPLRLRPLCVTPPLRRLTTKHARPASMAGEAFNPVKRPCRPRPGNSPSDVTPLTKGAEDSTKSHSVSNRSVSSRSSRLTIEAPSDGSECRVSTRPSTPPLSVASEGSSSQGMGEGAGGIATIISHVTSRTRSEILAGLDKDTVHVPDYAVNLLGGFDLIHDEFSLPDRELFIKPREMRPIEVAPPPEPADVSRPSEESDMGPYTSFALPPFTVDTSWSHPSTNSPSLPSTPRMHRPSLQPLRPDTSSLSRSSSPTTPRASQTSKSPRPRHSLLFYMRKHREGSGEYSPASSSVGVESLSGSSPVSGSTAPKKRFLFFSRK
ncbi:hypothetical protein J3R82DRAFT_11327 [Butyriboletus roseoflavus]|nr:hypothetical protein J3R82DRAFT_11327 [Butyriboletus roseoflavus]